jgi:hypothetical protein
MTSLTVPSRRSLEHAKEEQEHFKVSLEATILFSTALNPVKELSQ